MSARTQKLISKGTLVLTMTTSQENSRNKRKNVFVCEYKAFYFYSLPTDFLYAKNVQSDKITGHTHQLCWWCVTTEVGKDASEKNKEQRLQREENKRSKTNYSEEKSHKNVRNFILFSI